MNAGKRDAAYDLDLPEAAGGPQRGRLRSGPPPASRSPASPTSTPGCVRPRRRDLEVGDWVGLGLSHPCTSFDKWQLIPVVEADGTVVEYIRTFF